MPEARGRHETGAAAASAQAAGSIIAGAASSNYRLMSGPWERFRQNRPAVTARAAAVDKGRLLRHTRLVGRPDACSSRCGQAAAVAHAHPRNGRIGAAVAHAVRGAISLSLACWRPGFDCHRTAYGLVAGYLGGRWDELMMRAVDVLYTLPYMLLVMLFAVSIGAWLESRRVLGGEWSRFFVLALAIGGVSWLTMARVVRGQVLSLREQPFVEAARALGLPTSRILLRHLLPNLSGPILVFAALTVPQAILQESFLSLGVGIQPPGDVGLAGRGRVHLLNLIQFDWWLVVVPCVALSVTLLALNFVGDGIRDALDVKQSRGVSPR